MTHPFSSIGFIGLGVMGEPMCRNLAQKCGLPVWALDRDPRPMQRLSSLGVSGLHMAASAQELMARADVVFLSLPSGEVVRELCLGAAGDGVAGDGAAGDGAAANSTASDAAAADASARSASGLLDTARAGQVVVDLSTSPVALTRELAAAFAAKGATFIDAPVARTRAAAETGSLSVMVGADAAAFAALRPLLATMASDITLCGPVGCGQVVKILNNMVLFETVMALAEAKAIGERAGVDATLLFDTLAKGSADSFALRNHGMKAMLPKAFPPRAFSVEYARKDLSYALLLAAETGIDARGAKLVDECFAAAIRAGDGEKYHPVISRQIASE